MSTEAIEKWFNSKKPACIGQLKVRPKENTILKGTPLMSQQGQAKAVFLKSATDKEYIIKIFHKGKQLDSAYMRKVTSLLPKNKAFECGTNRRILTSQSLRKGPNTYYSTALADSLNNSILMPLIKGYSWNGIIDELRNQKITLSSAKRLQICGHLANTIKLLEDNQISHRDLSGGNVFINPDNLSVSLIDFDSLYHPSLVMPNNLSIGSEGYIAPFIQNTDTKLTYNRSADRFALAMLCVEILILEPSSPRSHEGGIFQQTEIYQRCGKTITYAKKRLKQINPQILLLFEKALSSRSFDNCPAPSEWLSFTPNLKTSFSIEVLSSTSKNNQTLTLPEDPWANMKGETHNGFILPPVPEYDASNLHYNRPVDSIDSVKAYLCSLQPPTLKTAKRRRETFFGKLLKIFPVFVLVMLLKKLL